MSTALARLELPANPDPSSASKPGKRRRLSPMDHAFVKQMQAQAWTDPQRAAESVGFKRPGIGYKLANRLSDLIEAARLSEQLSAQMELDEALRRLAEVARQTADEKVQLAALRTVLQVHGVLSDRPLPPTDRRTLAGQIEAIVSRVRSAVGQPGVRSRVRLAFEAEATSEPAEPARNSPIGESKP